MPPSVYIRVGAFPVKQGVGHGPIGIVHEFRWPVFTNIILKQRHLLTISSKVNGIWRLSTNLSVNGVKWWDINQL